MPRRTVRVRGTEEQPQVQVQYKETEEEQVSPDGDGRESSDAVDSHIPQPKPSRKRERTRAGGEQKNFSKKTRGRRRSLSRLPDMPLDILFEIFCHLTPLDLLHLSRTTKAVRNVLMWRSAAPIWKKVLSGVEGLPACPDDLNEAQYVRLVFDNHCYFCYALVKQAYWVSRVRCCKRCFPTQFIEEIELFDMDDTGEIVWFQLLPSESRGRGNGTWFLRERVDALLAQIHSMQDNEEQLIAFYRSQEIATDKMEFSQDALIFWQAAQLDKRAQELEDIRTRRRTMIMEKLRPYGLENELDLMSGPLYSRALEQKWLKEPTELTDRRWNNIKDTVINYMREAQTLRLAMQRSIVVLPFTRIVAIIYDLFVLSDESPSPPQPLPGIADVCSMPEILAFFRKITSVDGVPEPTMEQLEEEKDRLIQQLPDMCKNWRETCTHTLLSVIASQESKSSQVTATAAEEASTSDNCKCTSDLSLEARLELAMTWFTCSSPGGTLSAIGYPRILSLPEMTASTQLDLQCTALTASLRNTLALEYKFGPWNQGDYRVGWDAQSAATARLLVEACGKDPETTTAKEMDALDPRFACAACATWIDFPFDLLSLRRGHSDDKDKSGKDDAREDEPSKGKGKGRENQFQKPNNSQHISVRTFSWRRAIVHHLSHKHEPERWVLLDEQDRARAVLAPNSYENFVGWQCRWCQSCLSDPFDGLMEWVEVKQHLALDHDTSFLASKEGRDYFKALHMVNSESDIPRIIVIQKPHTWIPLDSTERINS